MDQTRVVGGKTPYEPSVLTRLKWWLGIYLPMPLVMFIYVLLANSKSNDHRPPEYLPSLILIYLLFPSGLLPKVWIAGYLFYPLHLIATFCVRNQQHFKIAIIILIIAVIFNLTSCITAIQPPAQSFSP